MPDSSNIRDDVISGLLSDIVGKDGPVEKETLQNTIQNILHDYNLSTDLSFVEKIASINFGNDESGKRDIEALGDIPAELKDASFLPVNTIADIALKQDIDTVISQIPELYTAIQVMRDFICETDVVTGRLARTITFDERETEFDDHVHNNIMGKIAEVEERLELHQLIKNHLVTGAIEYGEDAMYCIPYAKVFQDLWKYRMSEDLPNNRKAGKFPAGNMFNTSAILQGYGYHEQAIEVSLKDTIIAEMVEEKKRNDKAKPINDGTYKRETSGRAPGSGTGCLFTEQEIIELYPHYHQEVEVPEGASKEEKEKLQKYQEEADAEIDTILEMLSSNITFVNGDIALPVLEESAHDLKAVYEEKYRHEAHMTVDDNGQIIHEGFIPNVDNFFENVMQEAAIKNDEAVLPQFERIKGIYLKPLPATKLIPIRIDRCIVGYYYYSDMTRPDQAGDRKNSGLTGYTLRSPSIGYDTFAPDRMLCEKLATKIINNFDLKFMRDNTALHEQIVAILQSHNFNNAMMRFVYIPAEYVVFTAINKDGAGKGHSMLEPGLVAARMYMFLKLYTLLYQINNSAIRVYYVRSSGLDQNYRKFVQETIRKFSARRVTSNDIFNYRSSMTKVSGGSEMVMYMGSGDKRPIEIENIPPAEMPISTELLDKLKDEVIHSIVVPTAMIQTAMTEMEFAKEVELANTRMNTAASGYKIDMNPSITLLYKRILRWETDIDPDVLSTLKFSFKMNAAKELAVTAEMITNFIAVRDLAVQTFLTTEEQKPDSDTAVEGFQNTLVREYTKLLLKEHFPAINVDRFAELADIARTAANGKMISVQAIASKNILADKQESESEEEEM
jgi:hypothetical protein